MKEISFDALSISWKGAGMRGLLLFPHTQVLMKSPRGVGSSKGFSLIEVTIAIGIFSFVLVTLLGILPVGLIASQEAIRQTAQSHIVKQISSDLSLLPLADLSNYLQDSQYYDLDGKRVSSAQEATFVVELASGAPSYPGSSVVGANLARHLERVILTIRRPGESVEQGFRTSLSAVNHYEQR